MKNYIIHNPANNPAHSTSIVCQGTCPRDAMERLLYSMADDRKIVKVESGIGTTWITIQNGHMFRITEG